MYFLTFRSRLWTLFVVFQSTLSFFKIFDEKSWRYLSCLECFSTISRSFRVYFLTFRRRLWTLFVVFQSTWLFYCLSSMFDFDAICRGRTRFWRSLLSFRSWLWTLFVVAGHCLLLQVFLQKSTLNAICGVPEHLAILLFAFEAWFWRYLSWPDIVCFFMLSFRSRLWTLFVVFEATFGGTICNF